MSFDPAVEGLRPISGAQDHDLQPITPFSRSRECRVGEDDSVECPQISFWTTFGGYDGGTGDIPEMHLVATTNNIVDEAAGITGSGGRVPEYFAVRVQWVAAHTAAVWIGCNGAFSNCNSSGDINHPNVENSWVLADMTAPGSWVDDTGTGPLPVTDLYEDSHLGDGWPWGAVGNVLFWPPIPLPADSPAPRYRPWAYLLNPSPAWPVPDVAGNEFGKVLFTREQLPSAVISVDQVLWGRWTGVTSPSTDPPTLQLYLAIDAWYVPEPDEPPEVLRHVTVVGSA